MTVDENIRQLRQELNELREKMLYGRARRPDNKKKHLPRSGRGSPCQEDAHCRRQKQASKKSSKKAESPGSPRSSRPLAENDHFYDVFRTREYTGVIVFLLPRWIDTTHIMLSCASMDRFYVECHVTNSCFMLFRSLLLTPVLERENP